MRLGIRRATIWGGVTTLVVALIAIAAVTAGGIVAWEYSNSNAFCTNMCHAVHPEEPRSHATSSHARVTCVECHMGRLSTLQLMAIKTTHAHELWGMIVGYERPLASSTLRPARDNCEGCHWPKVAHDDTVRIKARYDTDQASTETRYRLILHTGFGAIREGRAKGVHWHVESDVRYVSLDPQRRSTPLVEVHGSDGKVTTYFDAASGVSRQELEKAERRRMECADCHNASGHPFPNPADAVDEAIAVGDIDRTLPSAKARAIALIAKAEGLSGPLADQERKIDELIAASVPKKEMSDDEKALEQKFAAAMKRILVQSAFEAPKISWRSFPNHTGHKDSPGCFRCHNGKHLDDKGQAIRLQCTLCHNLPEVFKEGEKLTVASTVVAGAEPPRSHDAPNFMRDHRTKLDKTCTACHGPIQFGREGGSFCSNPACHGRTWPEVDLKAVKPPG